MMIFSLLSVKMFCGAASGLFSSFVSFGIMLVEEISFWQQHSSVTQMPGGPYGEWNAAVICGEGSLLKCQRIPPPLSPHTPLDEND